MTDSRTSDSPVLSDVFRSNLLPTFVLWIRSVTSNDPILLGIEVFSIVLDANKVIAEIRWRLSKREKPQALSKIFESIEAKVLIAYVPSFTEHEVLVNADKVAVEIGKSRDEVLGEWERIKPFLRVHETAMQQVEVIELADPKDLVYMATQQQLLMPSRRIATQSRNEHGNGPRSTYTNWRGSLLVISCTTTGFGFSRIIPSPTQ